VAIGLNLFIYLNGGSWAEIFKKWNNGHPANTRYPWLDPMDKPAAQTPAAQTPAPTPRWVDKPGTQNTPGLLAAQTPAPTPWQMPMDKPRTQTSPGSKTWTPKPISNQMPAGSLAEPRPTATAPLITPLITAVLQRANNSGMQGMAEGQLARRLKHHGKPQCVWGCSDEVDGECCCIPSCKSGVSFSPSANANDRVVKSLEGATAGGTTGSATGAALGSLVAGAMIADFGFGAALGGPIGAIVGGLAGIIVSISMWNTEDPQCVGLCSMISTSEIDCFCHR